jgi:hypothetical protein
MKQSKSDKVMKYVAKHPDAKPIAVAKATGVDLAYVYVVKAKAKKAGALANIVGTHKLDKEIKPKGVSNLAWKISQGRTPQRMKTIATFTSNVSVKDNVNHPEHYKTGGIETIDFIEAKSLGYHLGNVVKYITRADHKGNRLEDLKKAQWYLNRAVANLEK